MSYMSISLIIIVVGTIVFALLYGFWDVKRHKEIEDLTTEFEELAREHERAPKGHYREDNDCIIFRVYYQSLPMSGTRMCVDRYRQRIYDEGFEFNYTTAPKIRQYIIEMKDEIAHLKKKERIWKKKVAASRRRDRRREEEDLRLHPWKKHTCDKCGHYSISWFLHPDGDRDCYASCGYTGEEFGYSRALDFSSSTACEHFKESC